MDMTFFEDMEARIPKGGVRTRFAPSPTGYMHVGNLRTALYAWLFARHNQGTFILRIEDTDQGRLVEDAVAVIYETMRKCGLTHDEGPDVGGPVGPYIQTERRDLYGKYAQLLLEKGGAYRCFCTKEELACEEHTCHCGNLSQPSIDEKMEQKVPYIIRQRIPKSGETTFSDIVFGDIVVPNDSLDDQVLMKSDGLPTYNFANVIDDHLMGITHVIRGTEYLSSAPKYNLLYTSFGWDTPTYIHCSPVMRDAQNKMSKRHGDPSFEDLMSEGYLVDAVINYIALLGWSPGGEREFFTLNELAAVFDVKGISKSPAIFDREKLNYFNASYLRALSPEDFHTCAEPYMRQSIQNPAIDTTLISPLIQPRCTVLTDIPEQVDFFEALPEYSCELYCHKKMKTDEASSCAALEQIIPMLQALEDWSNDALYAALNALAEQMEVKNGKLLWPVRIALAGKSVTPGGATEIAQILGKEESLRRLNLGFEKLKACNLV